MKAWLVLGVLIATIFQAIPKQADKPQSNQNDSKHLAEQPPKDATAGTENAPTARPSSTKREDSANRKPEHAKWRERIISPVISNWPLIAIAIWGILVARSTLHAIRWQAEETAKATQAMRDSLPHQERAAKAAGDNAEAVINAERSWVLVKTVGNPPEDWLALIKTGYVPGIAIQFGVFGKTPVTITDSRLIVESVPAKEGTKPVQPDLPALPDYSKAAYYPEVLRGNVLPPGGILTVREHLAGLTGLDIADLRSGKKLLCAYAMLKYTDTFKRERETATCYVYNFAFGGVLKDTEGNALNPPGFQTSGPESYHRVT